MNRISTEINANTMYPMLYRNAPPGGEPQDRSHTAAPHSRISSESHFTASVSSPQQNHMGDSYSNPHRAINQTLPYVFDCMVASDPGFLNVLFQPAFQLAAVFNKERETLYGALEGNLICRRINWLEFSFPASDRAVYNKQICHLEKLEEATRWKGRLRLNTTDLEHVADLPILQVRGT